MTGHEEPVLNVCWEQAAHGLATRGWARAPEAVDASMAARLGEDDGRTWRIAGDEGVVRQHVIGSYSPFSEALPVVRAVGDRLVTGLCVAAEAQGIPPVPSFNEVTWGRYPAGTGRITAHRDPRAFGGVVAVFTLYGHARFRAWNTAGDVSEWETGPGQLVILRAAGWPAFDSQCPVHEVEPPEHAERMIMTVRHNTAGAGGGYTV